MISAPRLYIRDSSDKTIAILNSGDYYSETLTRYLMGKSSIFKFTIDKKDGDYLLYKSGLKVSFTYNNEFFWMNVITIEQTETKAIITCVSLNLELNNETVGPYIGSSMTFDQYFNQMINIDRSITIGINEISSKKLSNTWDGTDTLLGRLISLVNVFDAEFEIITSLNPNGSLKSLIMNVYKEQGDKNQGIGNDRRKEIFRFGKDITTVNKKEDISTLYTAIWPKGADGLGIESVEKVVYDKNGAILYATYKSAKAGFSDPRKIYAPQSRDLFPSVTNSGNDKWILEVPQQTEYEKPEDIYAYGLGLLKKNSIPEVTWTIEGYIDGGIGDRIMIEDSGYTPTIYLETRITEQEIHFKEPNLNKTTFSNSKELNSKLSSTLLEDVKKLIDENKVYTCGIATDNGIIFKNGEGETTLTATVRDGAVEVTDKFSIEWFKDGTFLDTGAEITVKASDVDGKSVYKFVAKKADGIVAGMYEVTVTDVSDGGKGDDAILLHVTSVNGNIFKNTGVSTTLTVTIYVGDTQIDTQQKLINYFGPQAFLQWRVKRVHELSYTAIPLDDPRLSDGGFIFTLNVDDIDEKATFACDLDF